MLWVALNMEYLRSASQCLNPPPAGPESRSTAETELRVSNRRVHAHHRACSAGKEQPYASFLVSDAGTERNRRAGDPR